MSDKKRLIDANELIDYVKRLSFEGGTRTRNIAGNEVLHFHMPNVINKQPTVDAVEVVHGRWVHGFSVRCSVCNGYALTDEDHDSWITPYCPNCGAKMDGGSHEID